jgi:hypothetical protein
MTEKKFARGIDMAHNLQELADMAGKYGFMILNETGNSSETMVVLNIIKENLHTAKTMNAVKKEFGLKNVEKPFVKKGQTKVGDFCGKNKRWSNRRSE